MHTKHTLLSTQVYPWDCCSPLCSSTCEFWSCASPTLPMCHEKHHSTIPFVFTGGLLSKGTMFSFAWQFCVFALDCSSEIAVWSFFMLYRSKINIQGVHCAPGTNIWFVCTGTWKDNKIKKEITFKRLFCGFVSSKPEGRKTVIGICSKCHRILSANLTFFSRKKSNFLLYWLFVVKKIQYSQQQWMWRSARSVLWPTSPPLFPILSGF